MATRDVTIAMRDALKGGKNFPLKVYADNDFVIVDESNAYAFTKWDDEKGILFYFRLCGYDKTRVPDNVNQAISVCAINYDFIQAMEVAPLPLDKIDNLFNTMPEMSQAFKDHIVEVFKDAMDPNKVNMLPSTTAAIHGTRGASANGDEYPRQWVESHAETDALNRRNERLLGQ